MMNHSDDEENLSGSANVENLEITEENESDEEIELPPLSSYVTTWRLWCKFGMWPVIFLLVNVVAFSTLLVFDREEYRAYSGISAKKLTAERISMFQTNTAMSAFILLIDCAILLKAALFMEKEMVALETDEEYTSRVAGHHTNHLHAQASRKMDCLFQKRLRPRVSFFVSILYIAAALCGAGFLSCLGLRVYSASTKMKRDCAIAGPTEQRGSKTSVKIDHLPSELQEWARRWNSEIDRMSSSFIRLNDGRVFFQGFEKTTNETSEDADEYAIYNGPDYRPTLISTAKDGAIQKHRNVLDPRFFTSVKGDGEAQSQSFCCAYTERSDMQRSTSRRFGRDRPPRHLLCVASGEDVTFGFRNISQPPRPKTNKGLLDRDREAKMKAHDGALYFEYTTYNRDHSTFDKIFAQMEIYKLYPDTMKLQSLANVTSEENLGTVISGDGSGSACNTWIDAIGRGLASIVVFPASYWLLTKKESPSGLALAIVMVFDILGSLANDDFAIALGFVTALLASISLLGIFKVPPQICRETLVWVYYAIICYFSAYAWEQEDRGYDSNMHKHRLVIPWWSFVVLSSIVGVLLNHPVLQLSGWIGGTALACYGLLGSIIEFGGRHDDDDMMIGRQHSHKHNPLWMIPAGLVIGCGLVTLGHALTKYRAYVVYYIKRMWRATTASAAGSRRGSDDMMTGLLSR